MSDTKTGRKTTTSIESLAQHGGRKQDIPSIVTIIASSTSKNNTGPNIQQCTAR